MKYRKHFMENTVSLDLLNKAEFNCNENKHNNRR